MHDENSSDSELLLNHEYKVLLRVAQVLHGPLDIKGMMIEIMNIITDFDDLKVEKKAGIFLADNKEKVLNLYTTVGDFSQEFLTKDKQVPFGECLCGKAALSKEVLMSEDCFTDARHERGFSDMTAHGHYIVPLMTQKELMGVMFLYTNTKPRWYRHSEEVLFAIGGLIADAIQRKQLDEELSRYRNNLELLVDERTSKLNSTNSKLNQEISHHEKTLSLLSASKDQFRKLSHQIQGIREEEKKTIAREVHDGLGQSLTALKMDLKYLSKNLEDQPELLKEAQSMIDLVDETIRLVQRISTELRPPVLDAFGLVSAITWQAEEYEKRSGIKFDVKSLPEKIAINKKLETTLFRIFQECLTNIIRHAQASCVTVGLKEENGLLVLTIADDGVGIKKSQLKHPDSLGLVGIRERVMAWNGDVIFDGEQGKGTKVTVVIRQEGT